jgi:hypothetical protein
MGGILILLVVGLSLMGAPPEDPGTEDSPPEAVPPAEFRSHRFSEPTIPSDSILRGQLTLSGEPADSGTVVLHRVRGDTAAAADSVPVGTDGGFSLPLPTWAADGGEPPVLFALARRDGVPYFGPPFRADELPPTPFVLELHPARSVPPGGVIPPVEGRELTIRKGEDDWTVLDRFQLRNDSTVTWVAGADGPIVWQYPLPAGARGARYVDGDPSPEAVYLEGTGVQLVGPLRPGPTVVSLAYELEELDTRIPLPGTTEAMGIRVDESAPLLSVEGLGGPFTDPGATEGEVRIWTGAALTDRILHMAPAPGAGPAPWVAGFLGLVLLGVGGLILVRRGGRREAAHEGEGIART